MTICDSLSLFFRDPSDLFEVRVLDAGRPGRKLAGWFRGDRLADAARRIADVTESAGGIYFTPQRLYPACYRRCANVLGEVRSRNGKTTPPLTHDSDVIARRYLLIDVDPVRSPGHEKQCATESEKDAAFGVANSVREFLSSHSWATPLVVDSGNGWHLYYRLPLEESGGSVADWRSDGIAKLLRVLAAKFDTPTAKIDTSVYNASRIMKVPGTWARKGKSTKDRPHRMSRVVEVPSAW